MIKKQFYYQLEDPFNRTNQSGYKVISEHRDQQKIYKVIEASEFPKLKILQLNDCPRLMSFEFLAHLNAPLLEQIFIRKCTNVTNHRPFKKLISNNLTQVLIIGGQSGIASYQQFHRVKFQVEHSVSIKIGRFGFINFNSFFKLQFADPELPGVYRLRQIYCSLKKFCILSNAPSQNHIILQHQPKLLPKRQQFRSPNALQLKQKSSNKKIFGLITRHYFMYVARLSSSLLKTTMNQQISLFAYFSYLQQNNQLKLNSSIFNLNSQLINQLTNQLTYLYILIYDVILQTKIKNTNHLFWQNIFITSLSFLLLINNVNLVEYFNHLKVTIPYLMFTPLSALEDFSSFLLFITPFELDCLFNLDFLFPSRILLLFILPQFSALIINSIEYLSLLMGRSAIYLLSFFTYSTVHMMRATYSFNKHTFAKTFQVNDLFLGCLDALIYITLAIGTFLRYSILNAKKPVEACLWTAIPTVIGFTIVPVISLISKNGFQDSEPVLNPIVIALSFGMFGFFQLAFFPATLTIFGSDFNVKNDGKLVGIWSSKSNVGNIFGFVMSNLFVATFDIPWEYTMITCSVILLIVCILLYKLVKNPVFEDDKQIKTSEFIQFFKQTWANTEFKLYILSFSLFKAILYSYELWTPKFLADNGFKEYSGYVPTLFDVSTLFGSFLMGMVYQKESHKDQNTKQSLLSKYKFFLPAIVIIIVCSMYIFIPGSLQAYFFLGALMGLFLGAIYNSLENNEIMQYTGNDPKRTDMFSTINITIGCAMVGMSQFAIGLVLNLGESSKDKKDNDFIAKGGIYFVIAAIAVVAAILTFVRSWFYGRVEGPQQKNGLRKSLVSTDIKDEIQYQNPEIYVNHPDKDNDYKIIKI